MSGNASVVSTEFKDDVAIVWIDNPPINAIGSVVGKALIATLAQLEGMAEVKAVVLACKGRTFIAGADINEFAADNRPEEGFPDSFGALQGFSRPIVAAIHGTALGGGLEVALSCDFRIATADARVGLPEVKLGVLPGGGGTQLLPRLTGVEAGLEMILAGAHVPASKALKLGILDRIATGDLVEDAVRAARELAGKPRRLVRDIIIDKASIPEGFFDAARARVQQQMRNQPAALRIVNCVEAAVNLPYAQSRQFESDQFAECLNDPQAKALQYAFFSERLVGKIPGLPEGLKPAPIKLAAVIGAGTMGGGIAMNFANAGLPVILLEANQDALDRGLGIIRANYEATAKKGRMSEADVEARMALIRPTLSYDDLQEADFIIEAVFESLEVKHSVFAELDRVAKPGAILASNTSALSIDEIAKATSRPENVVGTHFFSPANVMRLCEIVRGESATSAQTLVTAIALAKKLNKVAVVAGNCYGFIGNRMIFAYLHQAELLLLEGASPAQIDKALTDLGLAMGPYQMMDLAGLDVGYKARKANAFDQNDQRMTRVQDRLVEAGRHGQKTRAGYYDYVQGSRAPVPSSFVQDVVAETAKEFEIEQREISDEEIVQRLLLAMVNVGCDILDEGMAYRASDIDIVYLFGYGFPASRGGPMFWAENEIGLPRSLELIRHYSELTGERWMRPSPLLVRLVEQGKGFADATKLASKKASAS